jgi:hypothetical protein
MPADFSKKPTFYLTPADETLLREFAPLFDIHFRQVDKATYGLRELDQDYQPETILPAFLAHRRLFAEISSRAVHWVHFHLGASCRDSLLGQGETGLKRAAYFYARNREAARTLVK